MTVRMKYSINIAAIYEMASRPAAR
jgi:hypothetical protein